MVNKRELSVLIAPLKAGRKDLIFLRRGLVFTPISLFYRECLFDVSIDRNSFYLCWRIGLLGNRSKVRTRHQLQRVYRPGISWSLRDPYVGDRLFDTFSRVIAPHLDAMNNLEYYLSYMRGLPCGAYTREESMATVLAMQGKFDEACDAMNDALGYTRQERDFFSPRAGVKQNERIAAMATRYATEVTEMEQFIELARNDRRALINGFHAWEAQSIAELKLEQHWIPTPYPCEVAGLV